MGAGEGLTDVLGNAVGMFGPVGETLDEVA